MRLLASAGGPLYEAREVLQAGVEVAERFRCESMRVARGASDEHLRWITASRSQPSDAAATLVESELVTPGTRARVCTLTEDATPSRGLLVGCDRH